MMGSAKYLAIETIRDGVCTCRFGSKCAAPGKHPVVQIHAHGVDDASPYEEVRPFVDEFGYNLAIALGFTLANGETVVALDIDPRNSGDETFFDLQLELGDLPLTRTTSTGGGGSHYFASLPAGVKLPASFGAGIDVKQSGGYVLTAPSRHISGGAYRWLRKDPIASLPAAWVARFASASTPEFSGAALGAVGETFIAKAFGAAGWLGRQIDENRIAVVCPRRHLHRWCGWRWDRLRCSYNERDSPIFARRVSLPAFQRMFRPHDRARDY